MRRSWAAVWVGLVVLAAMGASYKLFMYTREGGEEGYRVHALFQDALGIFQKTAVRSAGIDVGHILDRSYDAARNKAKVNLSINQGIVLYENAVVSKRAASLLGEFYLEMDPGTAIDARTGRANRQLKDGDEIKNVLEQTQVGTILDQVGLTLPLLKDILRDVKELTGGPVKQIADNANQMMAKNSVVLERLLLRIDNIAASVETITREESDDFRASLRNVREITEGIKDLVGASKGEVASTGGEIRGSVQKLQKSIDNLERSLSNIEKITGKIDEGKGTVGKLVNDDGIADNIEQITEDAGGLVHSITKLQTSIGLRSEYNALTHTLKHYFQITLAPRPDRFYLIELVDDPRGFREKTRKRIDSSERGLVEETSITTSEKLRFTLQIGQRWGMVTGRMGLKESTGGLGVDLHFFDDRLMLSTDIFDTRSNEYPRVQARANLALYKQNLFLVGGVDDVLNQEPALASGGAFFDWFMGLKLQFHDEDLKSLLFVGGGAAGAAAK